MLCDSHTHLDQFTDDELTPMLQRARQAGLGLIVSVGSDVASSGRAIGLAQRHDIVYAGVGVHPQQLKRPFTDQDYAALRGLALGNPKVVCISETGLDFQESSPDRRWQEHAFREHIRLARELRKPIDFHAREAYDEVLPLMREERANEVGAIWHYFQGDQRRAKEALDLGFYISLAKPLLRMPELETLVKDLPMECIVLETDSYPQPWKKHAVRRTEPSHLVQVAEKVAQIKGLTVEEVASITTANLKRALRFM